MNEPGARPRVELRHPWLRAAQYVLGGAAVVFIVLALSRSWGDVQAYDWALRPWWLLLSALVFVGFYASQALAWWLLLRAFEERVSVSWAAASWGQSILARYIPGNVFMYLGRTLTSQRHGLALRRVSAAMVYEQALGFCAALVTLGLLFPFWEYHRGLAAISLAGIPLLLVLLHPRVFVPLADRLLAFAGRAPLEVELGMGKVLALLCYFVASWFVAGLASWLLLRASTDAGVGLLPAVVAAFAFAYVTGMVAFVFPGGLGVREAVLAGALAGSLGAGVALAWAVLLRLWQIAVELAFVGLATLARRWSGGNGSEGSG